MESKCLFIVGAIAWLMTLFFAFVASASSYNNFVGFFCLTILMIFVTTMTGVVMIYKKFFSSMLFLAAFVIASIVLAELFEQKILFFVNQCCF